MKAVVISGILHSISLFEIFLQSCRIVAYKHHCLFFYLHMLWDQSWIGSLSGGRDIYCIWVFWSLTHCKEPEAESRAGLDRREEDYFDWVLDQFYMTLMGQGKHFVVGGTIGPVPDTETIEEWGWLTHIILRSYHSEMRDAVAKIGIFSYWPHLYGKVRGRLQAYLCQALHTCLKKLQADEDVSWLGFATVYLLEMETCSYSSISRGKSVTNNCYMSKRGQGLGKGVRVVKGWWHFFLSRNAPFQAWAQAFATCHGAV